MGYCVSVLPGSLAANNPDVAASMSELAVLLMEKGEYGAAEQLSREALAMRRRLLDKDSVEVAESLNDLDEGAALFRQSLAIMRKAYGDEHPEVASTLNNLAMVLHKKGDLRAAEYEALKAKPSGT